MQRSRGWNVAQRDVKHLTPSRQCRVVRGVEISTHHGQDRPDEALRLAQEQAKDQSERQGGLDRQIRKPLLPARSTGRRDDLGNMASGDSPCRRD